MPEARPNLPGSRPEQAISRLMLFFAIVYTVEGFCQAKAGIVWQPLTHYLKQTQGWDTVQIAASLAVLDVPVPGCKPGGVLVRSAYSLISTGTELMKVSEAGMSMLGKARSRPDQVAKVMQSVATNGVPATYRKVMGKLDSYTPLGYSLCGVVEQVGAGIDDVKVGDLVACAGNEHAKRRSKGELRSKSNSANKLSPIMPPTGTMRNNFDT